MYLLTAISAILFLVIGQQIDLKEWKLLSFHYHYRIGWGQVIGYLFSIQYICITGLIAYDIWQQTSPLLNVVKLAIYLALAIGITLILEWLISKKTQGNKWFVWGLRFCTTAIFSFLFYSFENESLYYLFFYCASCGIYLRNSSLGIAFRKDLCLAFMIKKQAPQYTTLTPPQYAGCQLKTSNNLPRFIVTEHGVMPNTKTDQTNALNTFIEKVGLSGGGTIFFPAGKYYFQASCSNFIKINYSHIYLEGETDYSGKPLAELICCGKTAVGKKNPWLSPFFITTGEDLQPSNEFFGLQFRNRKRSFSQSNSLSDPGSDGEILTPTFVTTITQDAHVGDSILHVSDADNLEKYILIGLYNTSSDGNLIKDILGITELRKEWATALRAGIEEAPSYQWLIEIKRIIDNHTIELVRPLLRDIETKYTPEIFNVEMLEDIQISNLTISSLWDGRFRHHGFPIYYSVAQTQAMDYGWNAINMKRVAHGAISNVKICNFSNPLYVLDSRNVTTQDLEIYGYDGHQGIKVYQHACDNLFQRIVFRSHFADMLGGEGNAYGNVFRQISYLNPVFNPVDFDFHGFSEGPMSPPSDNLFTHIYGFRYLKGAGSITHLPSLAQRNCFSHLVCEGEKRGDNFYYAMTYRPKTGLIRLITALGFAAAMIQKKRNLSPQFFIKNMKEKFQNIDKINTPRNLHKQFFVGTQTENLDTWCNL